MLSDEELRQLRISMVDTQLRERGIRDERVLDAMRRIPRHEFVPTEYQHLAYHDGPLPIGENQTISQPYIVGIMSQLLGLKGHEIVLEIGTGCGYQTAVLCELAGYVYSLERYARLASKAAQRLNDLGYKNLDVHVGDGSQGLPDMSPFDSIMVTAAAPSIPGPLSSQLSPNYGRMVIPVGDGKNQNLLLVVRHNNMCEVKESIPVRFVPLIGRYGFKADETGDDDPPASV